jgi:hypothetical protein
MKSQVFFRLPRKTRSIELNMILIMLRIDIIIKKLVLECGSLLNHLICVIVIEPSWFYVFYDTWLLQCLICFIDPRFINMMTLSIKLLSCSRTSKSLSLGMLMSPICSIFTL